jgi:exodeoxyribonuclease VII small subunit
MATKKPEPLPADIQAMSFEDAMAELEEIVTALERGETSLDDAINHYTRGAQLKRHCEAKLKEAKARVEKITIGSGGEVSASDADLA